jgi:hypothetical protein
VTTDGLVGIVHDLRAELNTLTGRVRDHDVLMAEQERIAATLGQLSEQLAELQVEVGLGDGKKSYKPDRNPRWWELSEAEKAAEVGRIRGWIDQIAKPWLGAQRFPDCVLEHDELVIMCEAASQAWRALWIPEKRTSGMVAAQNEYLIRIWPAIRDNVLKLTQSCEHQSGLTPLKAVAGGRNA